MVHKWMVHFFEVSLILNWLIVIANKHLIGELILLETIMMMVMIFASIFCINEITEIGRWKDRDRRLVISLSNKIYLLMWEELFICNAIILCLLHYATAYHGQRAENFHLRSHRSDYIYEWVGLKTLDVKHIFIRKMNDWWHRL